MLVHQGGVKEQPFGQSGLGAPNCFPVGGAKVRAEHKSDLEEQVVGKDVREGPCNIGMMFDLTKARFDVIGMDDNVIHGVRDP